MDSLLASCAGLPELRDILNNEALPCRLDDLTCAIAHLRGDDFPLTALLFQAGYVTIKGTEGKRLGIGIPNQEARAAFVKAQRADETDEQPRA